MHHFGNQDIHQKWCLIYVKFNMNSNFDIILLLAIFKLSSLFVGLALSYMGYRLFQSGIWGKAGELDAQFKDSKLLIRKAAPGSFFVILGAVVIIASIIKGFNIELLANKQKPLAIEKPKLP